LYGSLGAKYARALARSMQHTKEIKGANILNNATTTSVGGDGVALLSASHPLGGGGTASNTLSTPADLSETSLRAVTDSNLYYVVDDRSIPIALSGQKLIVPPQLVFIAERILKSNLKTRNC
jgi:hypothetical protein